MGQGIKTRLILAFILIILLPFGIVGGALAVASSWINNEATKQQIEYIDQVHTTVVNVILNNYALIDNYDEFHANLKPVLDEYTLDLRIVSSTSRLLYDSADREGSVRHIAVESGKKEASPKQIISTGGAYYFDIPITVNGSLVAEATVRANNSKTPYSVVSKTFKYIALCFGLGLLMFISLIILFTWYISRTILKPVRELSIATEKITQGDLEFSITYKKNDELGRFCQAFETMRVRLRDSLEKQREYEKSRIEMIAGISHDLRTPISSIKGYVEGLIDGVAEDQAMVDRYLAVIKGKTEQLDRQIEDLFQFSQLEVGRLEINPIEMDSRKLLENIFQELELQWENTQLKLNIIRPVPTVRIKADKQRIEQVIGNLINNAIQYAGEGSSIEINSYLEANELHISVRDNGQGIAADDLPYIFDRFYRGEKSRSRRYGGTGLGLATCMYLIEAHGGRIWAESIEGEGAVFTFTIPVQS